MEIQEIKVLNIDNIPYDVNYMSDNIKTMVNTYNVWIKDLAEAHKKYVQIEMAVKALADQIGNQVRTEKIEQTKENNINNDKNEQAQQMADPVPPISKLEEK